MQSLDYVPTVPYAQPSFYETTVVPVPKTTGRKGTRPYTHLDYERQRDMVFGDIEDLKEKATLNLLDRGWVPTTFGALVDPTKVMTRQQVAALVAASPEVMLAPEAEALAVVDTDDVEGQMDLAVVLPPWPDDEIQSALEAAIAEGDQIPEGFLAESLLPALDEAIAETEDGPESEQQGD